jgi:phosphoheptose isomerase
MKKKIIFYGNCQAATLARFFRLNLSDRFSFFRKAFPDFPLDSRSWLRDMTDSDISDQIEENK